MNAKRKSTRSNFRVTVELTVFVDWEESWVPETWESDLSSWLPHLPLVGAVFLSFIFFSSSVHAEWPYWSQRWAFGPNKLFHSISRTSKKAVPVLQLSHGKCIYEFQAVTDRDQTTSKAWFSNPGPCVCKLRNHQCPSQINCISQLSFKNRKKVSVVFIRNKSKLHTICFSA